MILRCQHFYLEHQVIIVTLTVSWPGNYLSFSHPEQQGRARLQHSTQNTIVFQFNEAVKLNNKTLLLHTFYHETGQAGRSTREDSIMVFGLSLATITIIITTITTTDICQMVSRETWQGCNTRCEGRKAMLRCLNVNVFRWCGGGSQHRRNVSVKRFEDTNSTSLSGNHPPQNAFYRFRIQKLFKVWGL